MTYPTDPLQDLLFTSNKIPTLTPLPLSATLHQYPEYLIATPHPMTEKITNENMAH